jgi:hypothetical protein
MSARTLLAAVLLPLVLAGCASGTPDAPAEEILATAGPASGLLLAHGTVKRGGEPLENANVVLQAMPVTSASDSDAGAQRWTSPAVRTDADGNYALRLDPSEIPEEYYPDSYSFLEFDLVFGDGAGLAVWHGMVFLRTRPDLWRTEGAGPSDGVLRVDVDLESGEVSPLDSRGEPIVAD